MALPLGPGNGSSEPGRGRKGGGAAAISFGLERDMGYAQDASGRLTVAFCAISEGRQAAAHRAGRQLTGEHGWQL